jgi:hypothetical protein
MYTLAEAWWMLFGLHFGVALAALTVAFHLQWDAWIVEKEELRTWMSDTLN